MKREKKEQRLNDFVERYLARVLAAVGTGAPVTPAEHQLELIAHSPESPVAAAVAARLDALIGAGVKARVLFALPSPEAALAPWLAKAASVRWLRDARLQETHEQLVLGTTMCWSGDAVRRGSTKTDLFESMNEGCGETVRLARRAFDKLDPYALPIRPKRLTASLRANTPEVATVVVPAPVESPPQASEPVLPARPFSTRH